MSKAHIQQMKTAVQTYFKAAQDAAAKIEKNNSIYRADIAEPENQKVRDNLVMQRLEAEGAVRAAQEAGQIEALGGKKLRGEDITADAKLLDFDLTIEQFSDLVDRYKGNMTMSILLKQYGDRKNQSAAAAAGQNGGIALQVFDTSRIATPERRAEVYDSFAMSALDIIYRINAGHEIGGGIDSPMLKASVEQFGERNDFTEGLFELL